MKNALLVIILLLSCGSLFSQQVFEKSETFPEFSGWTKLTQLQNGNTGLMEVTKKEGIKFTLFNEKRKKITTGKLPLKNLGDEFALAKIEGVYEIAGNITAFFITYPDENQAIPSLHRVIVSGTTGKLISDEIIYEHSKDNSKKLYGKESNGKGAKGFTIEKDPDSDYYAVIKTNTYALETINRIEVIHYGPDHKVINTAKYNTPSGKYKITNLLGAYVHGSECVLIAINARNIKKTSDAEAEYYVAKLNNGSGEFIQKELPFKLFDFNASGYFSFNKPKNLINMIFIIDNSQVNLDLNPATLEIGKPYSPDFSSINEIYKSQMKRKDDFSGMILGAFPDSAGNITFIYQHMVVSTSQSGNSSYLGDVALVTLSPEGKEISSAIIPFNMYMLGFHAPFAYNEVHKGIKPFKGFFIKDWYYPMNFYFTDNGGYIFFNNKIENLTLPDTKTAVRVGGISGTNGVVYTYKEGKIKKEFAFTKPTNPKEAKFINPGASDFNSSTNTYTTILTDPETKTSVVVWTQLD